MKIFKDEDIEIHRNTTEEGTMKQTGHLSITLRERVFHFAWCNRTEIDRVCMVCGSIVVEASCLHCQRAKLRRTERLQAFLAEKQARDGGA